jgi:hypothetical protein
MVKFGAQPDGSRKKRKRTKIIFCINVPLLMATYYVDENIKTLIPFSQLINILKKK